MGASGCEKSKVRIQPEPSHHTFDHTSPQFIDWSLGSERRSVLTEVATASGQAYEYQHPSKRAQRRRFLVVETPDLEPHESISGMRDSWEAELYVRQLSNWPVANVSHDQRATAH